MRKSTRTRRSHLSLGPTARTEGGSQSVLVALPVFNEVDSVANVLRAVRRYASDILAVNDGSTDGTGQVLNRCPWLRLITHATNIGYGHSLTDAFSYGRGHGFEWVITIDCDCQHEPGYIPHFRRELAKNDADIISGSRYLRRIDRGTVPPPPERVAINRAITALLNRHLGLRLTDAFCGFKAYRLEALTRLRLDQSGYGLPLQVWVQASRARLRIREIPVPLIYHDAQRNFAGILEDPHRRMRYYLEIIERELGCNVRAEIEDFINVAE